MIRTRQSSTLLLVTLTLMAFIPAQARADVKGRVRVSWNVETEAWVGEPRQVNLDILTTGFSFSDTHFSLPEVPGALFLQTDTTTLKLSEKRNGETWQILRYPLALFPQQAGTLIVPPISVRFRSGAAFGTEPRAFDLRTESLTLQVLQPPGTAAGSRVVTTPRFDLQYQYSPTSDELMTGDALQLEIVQTADRVSAMLLPVPTMFEADGISTYPDAPQIDDRVDRGTLTGVRTDRFTWVFERPGNYELPELRFQWWDPNNQTLKARVVPALSLSIGQNLAAASSASNPASRVPERVWLQWALGLAAAVLLGALAWRQGTKIRKSASRTKTTPSERDCFQALQKACRQNDPAQAYAQLGRWLRLVDPGNQAMSATEFAATTGNAELEACILELQYALITPGEKHWNGNPMSGLLRSLRRRHRQAGPLRPASGLPALNPR